MKVLNEEVLKGKPNTFVLIMNRKEAQGLVEMSAAAHEANKRKVSFRNMRNKLENLLMCY